jgi:hypothetical protein
MLSAFLIQSPRDPFHFLPFFFAVFLGFAAYLLLACAWQVARFVFGFLANSFKAF